MAPGGRMKNKFLYGGKASTELLVIFLPKAFQINIHGVYKGQQLVENRKGGRSVCDQHVFHAGLMYQSCGIAHIFPAHKGLVVGKGHADVPGLPESKGTGGKLFGRHINGFPRRKIRHGNFMVLAEGAFQITAVASNREDFTSGVKHV